MFEKQFYTLSNLADELNVGESTIKYWLSLYEAWIPFSDHQSERWYPRSAIEILRLIAERSRENTPPEEIKKILAQTSANVTEIKQLGASEIVDNVDSANITNIISNLSPILLPFLEEFAIHQKRIANAQERRAIAEEKKADALDKRATAERLKAEAMNNIASTLKGLDLNGLGGKVLKQVLPGLDVEVQDVGGSYRDRPAESIDMADLSELLESSGAESSPDIDDLDSLLGASEASSSDSLFSASNEEIMNVSEVDDLADLIDTPREAAAAPELDDLSALIGEPRANASPGIDDLSLLVDEPQTETVPEVDDLSALISDTQAPSSPSVDDLSALLGDASPSSASPGIDDLAALIESPQESPSPELDDLSALIGNEKPSGDDPINLDDLAKPESSAAPEVDDLSKLIDSSETPSNEPRVDDLSALLGTASAEHPSEPEPVAPVKPKEPKKKSAAKTVESNDYKNKIIGIVIKMKEKEKLSPEEAAQKLNSLGVKPISGRDAWESAAMLEIYNYIDIVKSTREH